MKLCDTCKYIDTCEPIFQMLIPENEFRADQVCEIYRANDDQASTPELSDDDVRRYKSIVRIIGAHNVTAEAREHHDFYATDPIAAEKLIEIEKLSSTIWEPACGLGHLSKVFIKHGFSVVSSDLIDRGFGHGGVDFVNVELPELFAGDIVTNPPFSLAEQFVEHGLSLIEPGRKVCMFLKVQFLEGQKRRAFFERTPLKTVHISSKRINCYKNGIETMTTGSMMALAWFIWKKGYQGEPVIKWFG